MGRTAAADEPTSIAPVRPFVELRRFFKIGVPRGAIMAGKGERLTV